MQRRLLYLFDFLKIKVSDGEPKGKCWAEKAGSTSADFEAGGPLKSQDFSS